jgi:hypothetical protein
VHITDLFVNSEFPLDRDVALYIGSTLKDMWSCKLHRDFPSKQFDVRFTHESTGELESYQLTFNQRRP